METTVPSSACFECVGYGYTVTGVVVAGKAFVFSLCRNCGGNGYVLSNAGAVGS